MSSAKYTVGTCDDWVEIADCWRNETGGCCVVTLIVVVNAW